MRHWPMAGEEKGISDGEGQVRTAALVQDLEALRLGLQSDMPLTPEEVRRRIDAIADAFLTLDAMHRGVDRP